MDVSKIIYKLMEDELVRLLLADVTDLTYIYDTRGNILFVNKIFERFTGHRPEEFYGKPFACLFDAYNTEKAMDSYNMTLKGESPQYELHFKDTKVSCEHKNFPLKDEKGNIIGVIGIARDITGRKHTEEGLKVLKESLEKRVAEHASRVIELNRELMEEIDNRKRLETEFKRDIERLKRSLSGAVHAMALMVESKDASAIGHQKRVSMIACCIAEEMGLSRDRIDGIMLAATIHDIGKATVPDEILNKPVPLTEPEFGIVRRHPLTGYNILKELEFPLAVAQIVFQHHERIDGSGYPLGLSGKDILLESKILGVADVVDAMSFPKPYRSDFGLDKALDEISQNRGILYDFNVAHACLAVFNEKGLKFGQESHPDSMLFEDVLL